MSTLNELIKDGAQAVKNGHLLKRLQKEKAPAGTGAEETSSNVTTDKVERQTSDEFDNIDRSSSVKPETEEAKTKAAGLKAKLEAMGPKPVLEIVIIYDASTKDFYVPAPEGGYQSKGVEGIRRHLKGKYGLSGQAGKDEDASEIDQEIYRAETFNRVDFVGDYAGYKEAKIYTVTGGYRLLVPRVQERLVSIQGNWDLTRGFLEGIFTNPIELKVFYAWMKHLWKRSSCEPGDWPPQQALVLIGITGSGKSAIQKAIITPILGRFEDPTSYFTGGEFNAHLAQAEHWEISDPQWSSKSDKEAFANGFKKGVADSSTPVHPKGKQQRQMEIFKTITLSLNDEEEPMSIFPLMPPSTLEKLIFLRADGMSEYTPNGENWEVWKQKVKDELPAFLWYLQNEFEIPEELRDKRYGVQYRNKEIYTRMCAPTLAEKEAEADQILAEAIFPPRVHKSTDLPRVTILTATDVIAKVHDPKFRLAPAAKMVLSHYPVYMGKALALRCKNGGQRQGFKIELVQPHPAKYRFTETF